MYIRLVFPRFSEDLNIEPRENRTRSRDLAGEGLEWYFSEGISGNDHSKN